MRSSILAPYFLTEAALITNSPLDNLVRILSDVPVPGPEIYPPVAYPSVELILILDNLDIKFPISALKLDNETET